MLQQIPYIHNSANEFQIAFIGNEREVIHAMRGIIRYHHACEQMSRRYKFFMFGRFPGETVGNFDFHYQSIGDNRLDAEDFQGKYHLILDPALHFDKRNGLSLAQWFEEKLQLKPEQKAAPFFTTKAIPGKIQLDYRQRHARHGVGNTVMLVLPSPQDREWSAVAGQGRLFHSWLTLLLQKGYTVLCPQIKVHNRFRCYTYDHTFYYSGYEEDFFKYAYTPTVNNINDFLFYLTHCRYYVGWNNWLADLAAAAAIPSILAWNARWETCPYHQPTTEYVRETLAMLSPDEWHEDYFKQKLNNIESRFRNVH